MEGQQKQTRKKRRRFPWKRAIAALVVSLLLSTAAILLILSTLSTEHLSADYRLVVIPILFTVIGQLIPLYQWPFPISLQAPSNPLQSPSPAEPATQNAQNKKPTTTWQA